MRSNDIGVPAVLGQARQLHYVHLHGTRNMLDTAEEWCHTTWPGSWRSNWHAHISPTWPNGVIKGSWWFSNPEDAVLFELTWG